MGYNAAMAESLRHFIYSTPYGALTLEADDKGITCVIFGQKELASPMGASTLTNQAATELQEYLAGKRRTFDVALHPRGSAFQQSVWAEALNIPYGEKSSPARIAEALGKPGSHRSVGTALRQCPVAPLIPIHRALAAKASGAEAKLFRAFCNLEAKGSA